MKKNVCIQVYVDVNLLKKLEKLRAEKTTKYGKKIKESISETVRKIIEEKIEKKLQ